MIWTESRPYQNDWILKCYRQVNLVVIERCAVRWCRSTKLKHTDAGANQSGVGQPFSRIVSHQGINAEENGAGKAGNEGYCELSMDSIKEMMSAIPSWITTENKKKRIYTTIPFLFWFSTNCKLLSREAYPRHLFCSLCRNQNEEV